MEHTITERCIGKTEQLVSEMERYKVLERGIDYIGYMRNSGMRTSIISVCHLILEVGLSCIKR